MDWLNVAVGFLFGVSSLFQYRKVKGNIAILRKIQNDKERNKKLDLEKKKVKKLTKGKWYEKTMIAGATIGIKKQRIKCKSNNYDLN